ncbi:MAG: polyphosphate kinase 1 [Nannocystaceae bacterium]|nr:polyphosphate kinase 1 [bacterium]
MPTPSHAVPTHESADSAPRPAHDDAEAIQTPPHPPLPGQESWAAKDDYAELGPEAFLNRELTWLNFAYRVAHQARDERIPLLERVKFLAIVGSTLDEFFMKRIGGLKQQVFAGVHDRTVDGRTPIDQIRACYREIRSLESRLVETWRALQTDLAREDIGVVDYLGLTAAERSRLRTYYFENIFPLVTPQAMDPAHPFPFISNLSLNLLVTLHQPSDDHPLLARVKVPVGAGIPRFLRVSDDDHRFVPLEDVMANNLDLLFPGMVIDRWTIFRITRNAHTEGDEEEADDLLALIESELRERKFAPIVRVQITANMPPLHRGLLADKFGLDEDKDVFEVSDLPMGLKDLFELGGIDRPDLRFGVHRPIDHPELVDADRSIFHQIRDEGSILLHHPYESFSTSVERFLREASLDPKVRAIKMTLYRTSKDTNVVRHLIEAARNGKQVAVVVELKARFDEMANIRWANHLEEAGIHVSYGVIGLKTHTKTILVVRRDYNGLTRYTHIGTGNYHAGNARAYTDLGLFSCDDDLGHDLTELFNYLTTGYQPGRVYRKLLPAPKVLKPALLAKIEREIECHRKHGNGLIQMKCNAFEDADVSRALYRASQAGVRIDLIVRDTCRIRPGIPGLSETIRVFSIVGRFLEHARIYYFHNNGDEEYFIGSADIMNRNLESRVEAVVPVERASARKTLRTIFQTQLEDDRLAWEMQPDGSYRQRTGNGAGSHEAMIKWAEARQRAAHRAKRLRPKSFPGDRQ